MTIHRFFSVQPHRSSPSAALSQPANTPSHEEGTILPLYLPFKAGVSLCISHSTTRLSNILTNLTSLVKHRLQPTFHKTSDESKQSYLLFLTCFPCIYGTVTPCFPSIFCTTTPLTSCLWDVCLTHYLSFCPRAQRSLVFRPEMHNIFFYFPPVLEAFIHFPRNFQTVTFG